MPEDGSGFPGHPRLSDSPAGPPTLEVVALGPLPAMTHPAAPFAAAQPVLVVGPVTWDVFDDRRVAGGAVSYVARLCDALDLEARLLVLGGKDADLSALAGHEVRRVDADTLTYRHASRDLGGKDRRVLRLEQACGRTLRTGDAPPDWPEPATLILAPLMPEDVDVLDFIDEHPTSEVALLAQGLQRAVAPDGEQTVMHRAQPSSVLLDALRPNVSVFLSREEVELWPVGALEHLAARCARVVVTDGARGATVLDRTGARTVAAVPLEPAAVADTTGAGDVFASAFILGVRAGELFAGRLAAAYAAAAVQVVGPAPLPLRSAMEARLSSPPDRGRPS